MNGAAPVRRIAVYGEIDLNLVDGSAIWLQSVCQVLTSIPDTRVTLLLRRSLEPDRQFLTATLAGDRAVELVDPGVPGRLGPSAALDHLERLDIESGGFDIVVLRGEAVLEEAAGRRSFAGRLWPYVMTGRGLGDETLRALALLSHRMLCQTDAVADELRAIVPSANGAVTVLPPMIPDAALPGVTRDADAGPLRIAYSGKLAPEYGWLEMVEAFARLRAVVPDCELHVIGDKIHRPPDRPDFHGAALRALEDTDGLRWHGAVPRAEVHDLLAHCDLALSIRDPRVEGSRELSTKVLEYGAAGLPVVLNRAPVYERLLGADYPLFIADQDDAVRALTGPALDAAIRGEAAEVCRAASKEFTFARVGDRLAGELPAARRRPTVNAVAGGAAGADRAKILVAGHDLKFVGPVRELIASTGASFAEDVWASHTEHRERASRAALATADTILCEWCLGNAAWYSRHVREEQRLVIRLHRMELFTEHPRAVDMGTVDRVVFVSQHILDGAVERFGWDPARLSVIPNAVDCDRLARPKRADASFVLGLIGYMPTRKRLDLALDLLERLRRDEPRFRLLAVGHPPSELAWVYRRDEEVEAFRDAYRRVQESDLLRGAVDFRPFTDDVPGLLERIGWIVSTSDSEGHQVSLAEGAASGAIPVILDRPGARDQYPDCWVHRTVDEAVAAVLDTLASDLDAESQASIAHASCWSPDRIRPLWLEALGL